MRSLILLALMLAACADEQLTVKVDTGTEPEVRARGLDFNAAFGPVGAIGRLRYLGGVRLDSSDARFGGFSGLRWVKGRLYAVTARAALLSLTLREKGDRLVGIAVAHLGQIKSDSDRSVDETGNAEALEIDPRGAMVSIAFEGRNRIHTYSNLDWERTGAPIRSASLLPLPSNASPDTQIAAIGGLRAFALLEWECIICTMIVLGETAPGPNGGAAAFLVRDSGQTFEDGFESNPLPELMRFAYRAPEGQRPTDAVALGARRMLVLNQGNMGTPASVTRLDLSDIKTDGPRAHQSIAPVRDGGVVSGRLIASLPAALRNYRFEGLAVRKEGAHTFVYMISDNGFAPGRGSLLLKFEMLD